MKITVTKSCLILLAVAMLIVLSAVCFLPREVASAADEVTVIKAPASDYKTNAAASRSSIQIFDNRDNYFYIPESYFLSNPRPFAGESSGIYRVDYCGEIFYINTDFTSETITVSSNESISPNVRLTLKEGAEVSLESIAITNDHTIKLLGYNADNTQIYVSATYNNLTKFGFISIDDLQPFTVPYQARTQAERDDWIASQKKPDPSKGDLIPNSSVALRIVLIIGIAIPAVFIVLLLFKPSKADKSYTKRTVRQTRSRDDFDYDDPRSYRRSERDEYYDRDYDRRRDYDRDYYDRPPRRRDEQDDRYYDDRDDR